MFSLTNIFEEFKCLVILHINLIQEFPDPGNPMNAFLGRLRSIDVSYSLEQLESKFGFGYKDEIKFFTRNQMSTFIFNIDAE